ncbi:hypothetical protein PtA15_11A283 [Puccinia triticina]|uniref:Uncharacterized protein n=1 Tax=Puccinia triticina TaxID=208348 RepID=A0ABY7CZ40_9BASI|nr:uncharacterized protein PtA15_11A283 [Puccinia triticina]WAQ89593.1 hypothetical protein PtA15_11A283 [Puccinia triticina]WAR59623.1 hypothetical protein PtB15_11B263 [Puccinia triticina]
MDHWDLDTQPTRLWPTHVRNTRSTRPSARQRLVVHNAHAALSMKVTISSDRRQDLLPIEPNYPHKRWEPPNFGPYLPDNPLLGSIRTNGTDFVALLVLANWPIGAPADRFNTHDSLLSAPANCLEDTKDGGPSNSQTTSNHLRRLASWRLLHQA